ncbi:MAG: GNAT family N-acetyltransferase, partial [Cyanobacteria bacterium P01_F01_bin.42]
MRFPMSISSPRLNVSSPQRHSSNAVVEHRPPITTVLLQPLLSSEIDQAATVLSQALLSNPLQLAVYQSRDETTQGCIKNGFEKILSDSRGQAFSAKVQSRIVGVYRMKLCVGQPFCSLNQLSPNLSALTIQEREQSWQESWASHDPMRQHSHLGPIGVLPEFQRQGVGTQLLQHYCRWLDDHGLAAYLEADKWQNVGLYEKFGFQVIDQAKILGIQ